MSGIERFLLNVSTLLVGASGVAYAVMKYLMTAQDPYAVVNHPLQPWALDLHVLASPLMILAIGMIVQAHVVAQIRKGTGRAGAGTGLVALACLPPMIATGYLIQVFTNETARAAAVWIHLVTGTAYLILFVAHLAIGRKSAALRKVRSEAIGRGDAAGVWMRAPAMSRASRKLPRGGA